MGPGHMLLRCACFGALALAAAIAAVAGPASAGAAVEVPFATQFASSGHGGITVAANTLMSCPAEGAIEAQCLAARAGTATGAALNNNGYAMKLEDVDGNPATFDSSTATLSLPPGATVTFAGLYYGARTSKGGGTGAAAAPNAAARGKVLLFAPGALGYTELSAAVNDSVGIPNSYTGFVDVTAQVAAAGAGEYAVANVQAGTGEDRYGGWSLVVAYSDPAAAPQSIRVYGGLASITQGTKEKPTEPLQIPITGLETPPAGTVAASVGLVAYEGDRGVAGDTLSLAGKPLADAANPANNIFNSSISVLGANATAKNPNYVNQLGFDADLIGAGGVLTNGVTEAMLEESTTNEQYLTQAVAVSIELDPDALEPPVVEPPPAPPAPVIPVPTPTPPAPEAPGGHKKKEKEAGGGGGKGSGEASPRPEPAATELAVAGPGAIERPTAIVSLRVTVASTGGQPVRGLSVCSRLPAGLTRLRAAGARVTGKVACWKVPKLAAGAERTFLTTARVDSTSRRTLIATTVVRAKNTRTRRRTTRIRVAPLPPSACGGPLRLPDIGLARRC